MYSEVNEHDSRFEFDQKFSFRVGFAVEAVLTFDFTHTIIEHILRWSRFFDFGKFNSILSERWHGTKRNQL